MNPTNIDNNTSHIDPFIDFNEYVNGEWEKNTKIPDDQSEWGTFAILHDDNIKKIINILDLLDNADPLKLLYKSLIKHDVTHTNSLRNSMYKYLSIIDDIKTIEHLGYVIGFLLMIDIKPFFNITANEDPANTKIMRLTILSPQLSLPEKEYYIDPSLSDFITSLKDTINDVCNYQYQNKSNLTNIAIDTLIVEESIAKLLKPIEERRDIATLYYSSTLDEFINVMSNNIGKISRLWQNIFNAAYLDSTKEIVVFDIEFF